jgi:HK97 family phage portal protein
VIVRTRGGREERIHARVFEPASPKAMRWHNVSTTGALVDNDSALGLPAVSAAVSLIAEAIASLDLNVWRGKRAQKRRADGAWQARLLQKPFGDDRTPFDFLSDLAACIETAGNCYLHKIKGNGRVVALRVLDPQFIRVGRDKDTGDKRFAVYGYPDGKYREFGTDAILHIRGLTIDGNDEGLSPIGLHRNRIGAMLSLDDYQSRIFSDDAVPPGFITLPERVSQGQADEMREKMYERYTDARLRRVPGILAGGSGWIKSGLSAEDMQFVETAQLSVSDVARIFRLPVSWLGGGGQAVGAEAAEQDNIRFFQALNPRIKRIESALRSDPDLFPGESPYPEFDTATLIRTDAKTAAEVMHMRVQDGTLLQDEARAELGLAPLPDGIGSIPQKTPVGGAPTPVPVNPPQGNPASNGA